MAKNGPVLLKAENAPQIAGEQANVATARAEQAEEKALSVDGKRIMPQEIFTDTIHLKTDLTVGSGVTLTDGCVDTNHLAADAVTTEKIDAGAVTATEIDTGAVTATKISVSNLASIAALFTGSITVGSDSSVGTAATGLWLTNSQILMKNGGVTYLNFTAGTYYFKGEVVADKITIASNAANSVTFGAAITIGGNIIMASTATDRYIYMWSSSNSYIHSLNTGALTVQAVSGLDLKSYLGASISLGTDPGSATISIGSTGSDVFTIERGTTDVISFLGDSNTVSFAGDIVCPSGNWTVQATDGDLDLKVNTTGHDMYMTIPDDITSTFIVRRGSTTVMSFYGGASTVSFAGDIITTRAYTGTLTIYRRDDVSNTQVSVTYTTLAGGFRLFQSAGAASPDCYASTSGGTQGQWGAVGDFCVWTGGSEDDLLWIRTSTSGSNYWMQVSVT